MDINAFLATLPTSLVGWGGVFVVMFFCVLALEALLLADRRLRAGKKNKENPSGS